MRLGSFVLGSFVLGSFMLGSFALGASMLVLFVPATVRGRGEGLVTRQGNKPQPRDERGIPGAHTN